MEQKIYSQQEFLKRVGLTLTELTEWEKIGLLKSEGPQDSELFFYTEDQVAQARQINHLVEIGYSKPEIHKILKKVGLPKRETEKSRPRTVEYLTVGELADLAHVNNRTIKYWEERGIIFPDRRSSGSFRLYGKHYVQICQLIMDLQNFGYTLDQIKALADLARLLLTLEADRSHTHPQAAALTGLEAIAAGMEELTTRMKELRNGIDRWEDMLKKRRKQVTKLKAEYSKAKRTT